MLTARKGVGIRDVLGLGLIHYQAAISQATSHAIQAALEIDPSRILLASAKNRRATPDPTVWRFRIPQLERDRSVLHPTQDSRSSYEERGTTVGNVDTSLVGVDALDHVMCF